jgi:hypothetical protein
VPEGRPSSWMCWLILKCLSRVEAWAVHAPQAHGWAGPLFGDGVFCSPSCWQYVPFDLCVKTQFNIFVMP